MDDLKEANAATRRREVLATWRDDLVAVLYKLQGGPLALGVFAEVEDDYEHIPTLHDVVIPHVQAALDEVRRLQADAG